MKAISYLQAGHADVLSDIVIDAPTPGPRDLRVAVKSVSVNPVDYKVRTNHGPTNGASKVIGYDAAGVVEAVGSEVSLFKVGDEVFYSGAVDRRARTRSCIWSTNALSDASRRR